MALDRPLALAALCAVLVLAGCAAPTAQPTDATTTDITVENGSFAVDHNRVYDRLQTITATTAAPPESIRVDTPGNGTARPSPRGDPPAFFQAVGFETGPVDLRLGDRLGEGYVTGLGAVVVSPAPNATRDDQRLLLAHELTHFVQFRNERLAQLGAEVDTRTTDGAFVRRSIVEGAAVYTTDRYLDRYGETDRRNSPVYERALSALPAGHQLRYGLAPYQYGSAYVADRVDSPADLPTVYERPPTTSQQVIHGLTPDEAPPDSLAVTVRAGDGWREAGTDRLGEAFLRYALESHIDPERAAAVAAGWGNDSLRIVSERGTTEPRYAWVHRWDDPDAASAFTDAMRSYLDARGDRTDRGWTVPDTDLEATVTAVSPETTVVLYGGESFLDAADTTGTDDDVTVTVGTPD